MKKNIYKICETPIDGKVIYESKNVYPSRDEIVRDRDEAEGMDGLVYDLIYDVLWKSKSVGQLASELDTFIDALELLNFHFTNKTNLYVQAFLMAMKEEGFVVGTMLYYRVNKAIKELQKGESNESF